MDVKIECERILMLCQGCLSTGRKLICVTGHNKTLFNKLRDDAKQNENKSKELLLCWECIALLNKVKLFQSRIKTAQYRLLQFLNTYCNKNDLPNTLSLLIKTTHIQQYDYKYKFTYEDEQKDDLLEQKDLLPEKKDDLLEQKDLLPEKKDDLLEQKDLLLGKKDETIEEKDENINENVPEIKIESSDAIKEEYDDISFDNDIDHFDEELKLETDIDYTISNQKPTKSQSIKEYEKYATITKINGLFTKRVDEYGEMVFLSEKEIEQLLKRDRMSRSYERFPFKCKKCRLGYLRRLDYVRHKTFHHTEPAFPIDCRACKQEILSQSHLEEHWRDYHTPMLRCSLCGELSRCKGELKKHLNRVHTKTYTCNDCSMELRSLREFSRHYKRAHQMVVCDYCKKTIASKRKLEKHIYKKHLPHHCSICDRAYRTYRLYETHLRGDHPELLLTLKVRDTNKEMRYCVECDKQFPSIYKYKRHLQQSARHTPKEKVRIPCPDCGKIFSRTIYKNNHYKLVHMKVSNHYCELCNKYFSNGYGLRKHIKCVHEKIPLPKDKICDLCGRGFSTNRILINHRRTHTGERPFKCQYCSASFAQQTAMMTHQKTQHKHNIIKSN